MPDSDTRCTDRGNFYRLCDATISLSKAFQMPVAPAAGEGESTHPPTEQDSTQPPPSPYREVHNFLTRLFSSSGPSVPSRAKADDDESSSSDSDEAEGEGNFLGRVQSYSKLMHIHTEAQLRRPNTSTLPSYARTMHAHTMNQLSHHHKLATQSAVTTPQLGTGRGAVKLPGQVYTELHKLSLDEVPPNPSNTPDLSQRDAGVPWVKRRSVTEPLPREFAMSVARKDFAVL
ncbi:hypothetical protein LTR91_019825 [Friedmanniomyces endolithicus]|uniref:Uncharacterized protein n=1 Tax=Friedmanniomyces endolithicus TaxID=329885 RepID=A0AAN6H8X8_9PEZI|nr:hypothetical protein LTR94_010513 [Friedmanniomyces endolithicus]KAK0793621.1 hypothetical protein LTR38_009495 [Friedmanniomyces endolithicus]KAK0796858.1 hypothetical protein LTR59_006999 [Friedmanniomyces endolithicus]KAK0807821.1 hypothetical protein LTR75_006456 [Friedmanniomyces endolithicus]KAK0838612.1 hypothetical protein LTR03_011883 [Friedmanniomyces endolithicus]